MFFETANIKRGHASEKPLGKPVSPPRNTPHTTAQRQQIANTVAAPRPTNTVKTVTAPGQPVLKKSVRPNLHRSALTPAASKHPGSYKNKATTTTLPKKVSGWPSHKEGIRTSAFAKTGTHVKPLTSYYNRKAAQPSQTFQRQGIYKKSGVRMYQPAGAGYGVKPGSFGTPAVIQKPLRGWSRYRRGIGGQAYPVGGERTYYQGRNTLPDIQVDGTYPQSAPAAFTGKRILAARGWTDNSDTVIPQQPTYSTFTPQPAYKSSLSRRHACRICGCTNNSCDTLSGFGVDSTQLSAVHKSRVGVLARKILAQKIRSVTATGYTDASGSDDYNLKLGYRRAQNVIKEIMNKMHEIKPYSEQNVFWKIRTKGRLNSVSANNDALNRRVEVCLR